MGRGKASGRDGPLWAIAAFASVGGRVGRSETGLRGDDVLCLGGEIEPFDPDGAGANGADGVRSSWALDRLGPA